MVKLSKSDQKELHANWDKLAKTPGRIKWMKMQYPNKKKALRFFGQVKTPLGASL